MRRDGTIEAIWNTGRYFGANRPAARVTVNRTWTLREVNSPASWAGRNGRRNPMRTWAESGTDVDVPIQLVKSIQISRSMDSDSGTMTLTFLNAHPTDGPAKAKQGMLSQRRTIGYAAPAQSPYWWPHLTGSDATWGDVSGGDANHSYGMIAQGNMMKTYEGYGASTVITGVWIIDTVSYNARGEVMVNCRDLASLLIDQNLYPPLLPVGSYPTNFYSASWNEDVNGDRDGKPPTSTNYDDLCCDEATEIFTQRGWLRHDEVKAGDLTLSINPTTWQSEWADVLHVYERHGVNNMVRMAGTSHDSLVTENHKWLVQSRHGKREFRLAKDLNTDSAIPIAAQRADTPVVPLENDAMVEAVGWFWTEGYIRRYPTTDRVEISQSATVNQDNVRRIDEAITHLFGAPGRLPRRPGLTNQMVERAKLLLSEGRSANSVCLELGISDVTLSRWQASGFDMNYARWSRNTRPSGVVVWTLDEAASRDLLDRAPNKVLDPEFICNLTQSQLDLLIDVSMMADGHTKSNGCRVLSQASQERIDGFVYLCCAAGLATSVAHRPAAGPVSDCWSATILKQTTVTPVGASRKGGRMTVTAERYEGTVWCPSTEHHNWLARRNGTVYFTGNSDIVSVIAAWSGFCTPDGSGVLGGIETTGIDMPTPLLADKFDKKAPIDAIKMLRDIVGYTTMVDQEGGFRFMRGNQWKAGNLIDGQWTGSVFDISEDRQLLEYTATGSKKVDRSAFIAAEQDPYRRGDDDTFPRPRYASFNTNTDSTKNQLHGMHRIAILPVTSRVSFREMVTMAELTGLRSWFQRRHGKVTIPGNPLIDIDDQVRVFERVTFDHFLHHVNAIESNHDLETGVYTMELTTHWMGADNSGWEITVDGQGHVSYNTGGGGAEVGADGEFARTPLWEG